VKTQKKSDGPSVSISTFPYLRFQFFCHFTYRKQGYKSFPWSMGLPSTASVQKY
jgi:hypothetical protein